MKNFERWASFITINILMVLLSQFYQDIYMAIFIYGQSSLEHYYPRALLYTKLVELKASIY